MNSKKIKKRKSGRPKITIDWDKVDGYLRAQCDGTGIASILGIAAITLYRACEREHKVNFEVYSAQKKGEGKEILRATQFKTAVGGKDMPGNVTMQIWLGKQYLGQSDKQEIKQNVNVNDDPFKNIRENAAINDSDDKTENSLKISD